MCEKFVIMVWVTLELGKKKKRKKLDLVRVCN